MRLGGYHVGLRGRANGRRMLGQIFLDSSSMSRSMTEELTRVEDRSMYQNKRSIGQRTRGSARILEKELSTPIVNRSERHCRL